MPRVLLRGALPSVGTKDSVQRHQSRLYSNMSQARTLDLQDTSHRIIGVWARSYSLSRHLHWHGTGLIGNEIVLVAEAFLEYTTVF